MKGNVFLLCALLLSVSVSWAGITWSEPILLTELNDTSTGWNATYPLLSKDDSTLYFGRRDASGTRQIYTATRDSQTSRFSNVSQISELATGNNLYSSWLSSDGLRLYYGEYDDFSEAIFLKMATRLDVTSPWSVSTVFSTIHGYHDLDAFPSLSSDELTMYYASDKNRSRNDMRIWKATRSSIDEQFSNPTQVMELDTGNLVTSPCLLPDGLTIYFTQEIDGNRDIFKAIRDSVSDPFASIKSLSLNTLGIENFPYVTADESEIFFCDEPGDYVCLPNSGTGDIEPAGSGHVAAET